VEEEIWRSVKDGWIEVERDNGVMEGRKGRYRIGLIKKGRCWFEFLTMQLSCSSLG